MFFDLLALIIPHDTAAAEHAWRMHHPAPPPEDDDDDDDDDVKPGSGGGNIDPDDDDGADDDEDDDDDETLWTGDRATLSAEPAEASMKVGRGARESASLGIQGRCEMRFGAFVGEAVKVAA
jgi:hypothetical protein